MRVPRHVFLPVGCDSGDENIDSMPLEQERMLPGEQLLTKMLGALALDGTERVLDFGSGSGYQAAVLSHLAREVYSTEIDAERANQREHTLGSLGCGNVHVVECGASAGYSGAAPYQAIFVGAGVPELPKELLEQLDVGGRLIVPLGDADGQLLARLRKRADALDSETLGACHLGLLTGARWTPSTLPWSHLPQP